MARYLVKDTVIRMGGSDFPPGSTIELDSREVAGLEQFLVDAPEEAGAHLGANQAIALIQETATPEELDKFVTGETRKTVLAAIAKRQAELTGGNTP
jgi:hypothetical protein